MRPPERLRGRPEGIARNVGSDPGAPKEERSKPTDLALDDEARWRATVRVVTEVHFRAGALDAASEMHDPRTVERDGRAEIIAIRRRATTRSSDPRSTLRDRRMRRRGKPRISELEGAYVERTTGRRTTAVSR